MYMLETYSAQLLSILRIVAGLLFLQHGTTKYLGSGLITSNTR